MRDLKYYKDLKYRMAVEFHPEDSAYFVKFPDLSGCIADGKTPEEAVKKALVVKDEWLAVAIESGWKIPEPSVLIETSGRITLRLPKTVHEKLVDKAEQEEVSLNQLILNYVAEGLERTSIKKSIEQISENISAGLNRIEGLIQTGRDENVVDLVQSSEPLMGMHQADTIYVHSKTGHFKNNIWDSIYMSKEKQLKDSEDYVLNS
ncbi:MAG: type II toxin-antitoxin system HicB family antitoxin [Nitrospirota bacterium]|nr:type II toxin-antitoxin system HicB family antitoxin [Nitrospirota bacterium]